MSLSRLVGANREYVEAHLPHLSRLLAGSAAEVMAHAEVCVVGARTPELEQELATASGKLVVDLVRLPDAAERRGGEGYVGVAW